jgi:N-methylhydantoinase B
MELRFPDGNRHKPKSKEIISDLPSGTILHQVAGGGGGYGKPYQRPAELVAKEVRNGVLSIQKAREDYGVVIDPEKYAVDPAATERLRGKRLR